MFQEVPNSYREAMSSEDSDKWLAASQEEFEGLTEMGVWKLVDRPHDRKTIKCRWTYVLKSNGRYKARLVAKGYTQVQGIDYEETFSPVARYKLIRYLLAHAALLDWEIEAMDVKLAYLHGVLEEEIYIRRNLYGTTRRLHSKRRRKQSLQTRSILIRIETSRTSME